MSSSIASRSFRLLASSRSRSSHYICRSCALQRARTVPVNSSNRAFTSSPWLYKKAGKAARDTARSDSSPPGPAVAPNTATDDVFDFLPLEASILKAIEQLTHKLSELRPGGRFNPEILESLQVQLDKRSGAKARLGDLAQVITRGRTINIIVGEEDHVKYVSSAIISSPHSLNPQSPSPDAPTALTIHIPPATGESRRAALDEASKISDEAVSAIKAARQTHHKKMRSLELAKKVRPDDSQKAHKQMEEVVKKGTEEVKRIVDGAKRVLENS